MSGQPERLEEALVGLVVERATGMLEAVEEPRRWQFFFDSGDLVATRSNLKSESEEALRKEMPSATEPELMQLQAARRVINAMRAANTWAFKVNIAPSRRVNLHVRRALFEAVRDVRSSEELQERLAPVLKGWPVSLDPEAEVTATSLDAYLAALDGSRPGEDIVTFAPAEPSIVLSAVWLAWRLGLVDDGDGQRTSNVHVEARRDLVPTLPMSSPPSAPPSLSPRVSPLRVQEVMAPARAPAAPATLPPLPRSPTPSPPPQASPATLPPLPRSPATLPPIPPSPATLPPLPTGRSAAGAPLAPPGPTTLGPNPPGPMTRLRELEARLRVAANHFSVLGVSWEAPPQDLRAAYMGLAKDLHPDRFAGTPTEIQDLATELFDKVRAAWEELGDEAKRLAYIDRVIHGKKSEEEEAMEAVQRYLAAEADFKRGMAAFNAGQTISAFPHFQAAAEKAPDEVEFRGFYGYALFFSRLRSEPEKAIEGFRLLEQAIADNNNQERKRDSLHVLLARAWRERGDLGLARRAAMAALKINPNNSDAPRLLRRIQDEEAAAAQKAESGLLGKMQGALGGLFKKKS